MNKRIRKKQLQKITTNSHLDDNKASTHLTKDNKAFNNIHNFLNRKISVETSILCNLLIFSICLIPLNISMKNNVILKQNIKEYSIELDKLRDNATSNSLNFDTIQFQIEELFDEFNISKQTSPNLTKDTTEKLASISYNQLLNSSSNLIGKNLTLDGNILDISTANGSDLNILFSLDGDFDKLLYLTKQDTDISEFNFKKGDNINITGTANGLFSYKTVKSEIKTVPNILVESLTKNN